MSCDLAFVYKYYPFDPTEHALLRWLRRVVPSAEFYEFPADFRKNPDGKFDSDPGFLEFVKTKRPRQVWVWNNLLYPGEIAACRDVGAKVAGIMNSFVVMHGGHFPSQASYLEQMRSLDAYFVPHFGDIAPLRAKGVNALEMPFCYDPERYFPLPKLLVPSFLGKVPVLFIGSVSESAASNRRRLIEALAKRVEVHVITFKNPDIANVVWHRPTNKAFLLNWWQNRSSLVLNVEDVGEAYGPEVLNQRHVTLPDLRYSQQKVFHGNHVFQAMGSRRICLSEFSEPLTRFCEPGKDILTWNSPDEAADKALEILANPVRLEAMQDAALEKVRARHTVDRRIGEILEQMQRATPLWCHA